MNRLTVRLRIFLSLLFIAFITSLVFSYKLYSSQKDLFFSSIEDQLKAGANAISLALGDDYVDKYTSKTPISEDEHFENLSKLGAYASEVGLEYIYIMVKEQDKVYIHISSATEDEIKEEEYDTFMTLYEDVSDEAKNGFIQGNEIYEEAIDKYGHFYSYLGAKTSKTGKVYLVGADMEVSIINKELNALLYRSIGLSILMLIFAAIFAYYISNIISKKIKNTQNGLNSFFEYLNGNIKNPVVIEVNSSDEFDMMNTNLNKNIHHINEELDIDRAMVEDTLNISKEVKNGHLNISIQATPINPQLLELKNVLNDMFSSLYIHISTIKDGLAIYTNNDFTHTLKKQNLQGDIYALIDGVNKLGDVIREMLSSQVQSGDVLQNSANTLSKNVEALSSSSNQQAASIEETAAAIENVTQNISSNNQKANQMANMAKDAHDASSHGKEMADNTVIAMNEINDATTAINEAITTIDQIAFQTNILSLNAAVEAATAGEAGKGFAVVASEVRNLANRSSEAAKQIKDLAQLANQKSTEGLNISNEMIEGFGDISDKITQTLDLVKEVVNANSEQLENINQINTTVNTLDSMTQHNATNAQETEGIAKEVSKLASDMVEYTQTKKF